MLISWSARCRNPHSYPGHMAGDRCFPKEIVVLYIEMRDKDRIVHINSVKLSHDLDFLED